MKTTPRLLTFTFLFLFTIHQNIQAQSNEEKALTKAKEAVKLVDEGRYPEGIRLLEEAHKLDPKNTTYPYEIAYAYYSQKDYKKAIKCLEPLVRQNTAKDNVYQLIGNAYDLMGDKNKALSAYDEGLQKFPSSGSLHLERGNMQLFKEDYDGALFYYEKGIEAAPDFASNYYWAARIYCSSSEKVWGIIYGEIFLNLERNSKRSAQISKLLYDTYKQSIKITSDTSAAVDFCKQAIIDVKDLNKGDKMKLPFGAMVYAIHMLKGVALEKQVNLISLNNIRTRFVKFYFEGKTAKEYPNVLFDYQKQLAEAGHLEAYNYWLLSKGEEETFAKWKTDNQTKWESFVDWFNENPLELNPEYKFYRKQY